MLFFRLARKTQIGRGRWDLTSCQVSLNSVQWFQRRSRKCISQSETRAAMLFLWSDIKKNPKKLGRRRRDFSSYQVLLDSDQRFQRRSHCFSDRPEKHILSRGRWGLASCTVSLNSVEKSNMYQPTRGQGRHLVFPVGPKNTSLVEDVEILFPVKFGRGRWDLVSCQVSLNFVQSFLRRSRKCLSQSEAWAAILLLRSGWKALTL